MRLRRFFALVLALDTAAITGIAAASADPTAENLERLPLFSSADIKLWSTAESTVQTSTQVARGTGVSLHWHVSVDYQTGEPKYPIGWPRLNRSFPIGPLRDWSGWDYLHGWVYVATKRDSLPTVPAGLGLHTPDRTGAFQRTLSELKANTWVEIRLPVAQIPRHHDVRQIQFHIAEANYRDRDELDFYFSDLALLRHAGPTILAFSAESAVLFSDARQLPLRLHLAGIAPGTEAEVICELRRANRSILRRSLKVSRGVQTVALQWDGTNLEPGDYDLRAQFPGQPAPATARLRVVPSPWP